MEDTIKILFKKSVLVLAASLLAISSAQAVLPNATTNLSVNIVVLTASASTSCALYNGYYVGSVTAPTISASYTSGASGDMTNWSLMKVQCNGNDLVPFTVSAGTGNHSNGSTRRASANGGVDFINYKLEHFTGYGYTSWDDTVAPAFGGSAMTGTTSILNGATTSSSNIQFQLMVPDGQNVPASTYTDVVLLTATF